MSKEQTGALEDNRCRGPGWVHFWYVVGILAAVIVGLLTLKLATHAAIVKYVSFALTLASILLAVVAIFYAITSNASLVQSISNVVQATGEIRGSASSMARVARALDSKFQRVSEKLDATHSMVAGLSNPGLRPSDRSDEAASAFDFARFIGGSSPVGKLSVYAAAVAFESKKSFSAWKFLGVLSTQEF